MQVTVEVHALGLNFADIFAMQGLYSAAPRENFIPGLEYAGKIIKTGNGVQGFKAGDRVMGVTRFGAYASHLNIDHRYVRDLPQDWTFSDGAAFPVQALTAYYGLKFLGDIREDMTVLIHSGAGGVGIYANRIAKKYDAYTIGTVGSKKKLNVLEKENYNAGIVRGDDFEERLKANLGGRNPDLIMECMGGKYFKIGWNLLAPQGRMIVYGSARYMSSGNRPNYLKLLYQYLTRPKIDPQKMIEQNKGILGFNLIWLYDKVELMDKLLKEIDALNLPKPYVGHAFKFQELPDAIRLFQSGETTGKVIVEVS